MGHSTNDICSDEVPFYVDGPACEHVSPHISLTPQVFNGIARCAELYCSVHQLAGYFPSISRIPAKEIV